MLRSLPYWLLYALMGLTVSLAAWLSLRHPVLWDLRHQPQWQVSAAQVQALQGLHEVTVEVYVGRNPRLRRSMDALINPLKMYVPSLQVVYHNPETEPVLVRERNITREGQLYVRDAQGRGQLVSIPSPSNLLAATLHLQAGQQQQIVHLQGDGERAFLSDSAGSWRDSYLHLRQGGVAVAAVSRQQTAAIPDHTAVLVIADPDVGSLDDAPRITRYLADGGNMLYTTDQPTPYLPPWLATVSGLRVLPETISDPDGKQYGIDDPKLLLITTLGDDASVNTLPNAPLLAHAAALMPDAEPAQGWTRLPLLYTSVQARSGTEQGPFVLGWLLSREKDGWTQKIIILGDSDVFTQHYRSSAGNSAFIDSIINSLLPERVLTAPAPAPLTDQYITLSTPYLYGMAALLLLGLPLLWVSYYFYYQRRQRCRYR